MASPYPQLQGLTQKASAPEERTAELKRGPAPFTSLPVQCLSTCQGTDLGPNLSCTPLVVPRNMTVNEVNLLQVSIACKTRACQQASRRGFQAHSHHDFLGELCCSPEPSSLGCLGPRGSRASSEIRKDSSEKSSVDFKAERRRWDLGSLQRWEPYGLRLHSRDWGQVQGQPLGDGRQMSPSHDLYQRYQHIGSPVPSFPPR